MDQLSLSLQVQPRSGRWPSYLKCAPHVSNAAETGYANCCLEIKNTGTKKVTIESIEISVEDSATDKHKFATNLEISAGGTKMWTQTEDYTFALPPAGVTLQFTFSAPGLLPKTITRTTVSHANPTPSKSYLFWARVRDLRPGEFWHVDGKSHAQDNFAQLFAYDVGVGVKNGSGNNNLLPGTAGDKNEHFRIWGKPIYAIAKGKVVDGRNDFPTNEVPGIVDPKIEKFWTGKDEGGDGKDGNGNFMTVRSTTETVLYAHMIPGTVNPKFATPGANIEEGELLGLVGNSGASGGPHLHIHSNVAGGTPSWFSAPRPMRFRGVHAVIWSKITATSGGPWSKVNGRGFPTEDCAIWPSDATPFQLVEPKLRHFAINENGSLWSVATDKKIRTTSDKLPLRGVLLDVDPKGLALGLAVKGSKPYIIGSDKLIWEGKPNGWFKVAGSPPCKRLTLDRSTGKLWVVAENSRIYSYTPKTKKWAEPFAGGKAKDIAAFGGQPYVIGMDDAIWTSNGNGGLAPFPGKGKGKRIAIDHDNGQVWVIGMNDGIWKHVSKGNWSELPLEGRGKELAVYDGVPYVIGLDSGLWQSYAPNGWLRLNLVQPK